MKRYKIDSDVPMPTKIPKECPFPFDKMKVGDSFVVSSVSEARSAVFHAVKLGLRITYQTEDDKFRVWLKSVQSAGKATKLCGSPKPVVADNAPEIIPPIEKNGPPWLKVSDAVTYSGIGRTTLFALIRSGEVKSSLARRKGNISGNRLVLRESLDSFLLSHLGEKGSIIPPRRKGTAR